MPQWTLLSILTWTTEYFQKHEIPSARLDAEILLAHQLNLTRVQLYLQFERPMAEAELQAFKVQIQRRVKHEPVASIVGEKEFWSLKFKVGSGVLIPRPETEMVVEEVMKRMKPEGDRRFLDVGTGSGILAVTLAKEFPQANVEAWDISEEALGYARENAQTHGVAERISFMNQDAQKYDTRSTTRDRRYDLIVSNPPYIATAQIATLAPEVSQFDPKQALDGGEDGLDFYRCLGEIAPSLLKPAGMLVVEIGDDQGKTVPEIFQKAGFKDMVVKKDYSGLDRVVVGIYG